MTDQREPMDTDMVMVPRVLLLVVCSLAEYHCRWHERIQSSREWASDEFEQTRAEVARLRAYAQRGES